MKYVDELKDLKGKAVFLRADLNVPFNDDGTIADDHRITASIPTIQFLAESGAKIIAASHMSKEKGIDPKTQSLEPVAKRIAELTGRKVHWAGDSIGENVERLAAALAEGEVLLLENLHQHPGEETNDPEYAKQLAQLAQVYVCDAFATAHRKYASVSALPKAFAEKAGGFIVKTEMTFFEKALREPKRPLIAIFGGAKVSTKMAAIKFAGAKANEVIIGGAMANTFFVARGLSVGKSLYEPTEVEGARQAEEALKRAGVDLHLPVDVVVAKEFKGGVPTRVVPVDQIGPDEMALDIGPESTKLFDAAIKRAATVLWNGPMGAFETEEFATGTYSLIDSITGSNAFSLVGGGDTDLALHRRHAFEKMSYVSTAGGAFLKLLEGGTLPALKALES